LTPAALITAVLAGAFVGSACWVLVQSARRFPLWFPVAIGITAGVLGTVGARIGGARFAGSLAEFGVATAFAGVGVTVMLAAAARRGPDAP
jgi:hypothetical protein